MARNRCFLRLIWTGLALSTITVTISDLVGCQDDFYFRKWPVSPSGIVRKGQNVEFECRVSSEDRVSISWTLNGELLLNTSRRYQNESTGFLVIRRVDHLLDSGAFACTATNISSGFSIASQPATLMIQWIGNATRIEAESLDAGRKILVDSFGVVHVDHGTGVVLQCSAEGSGELQYEWFQNGRKIPKNKSKRLTLNSVSAAECGTYSCSAKNGAGTSKFNVPFSLSTSRSGKLVRFTTETAVALGSTVRLPCTFQPPSQVQWFFRGNKISQSPQYSIEADGQLVISKMSQPSEGWYSCRKSENGDSNVVEEYGSFVKVAYLHDFQKSAIDPPSPLANGNYYFAEYSPADLTCITPDGIPPPVVWWEGPSGQMLTNPSETTESVITLSRVLAEDSGSYKCWASNAIRNVSIQANLIVTSPPVIQHHPASAFVNEEETVSMSCVFVGNPAPATSIQWLKDGQPLSSPKPLQAPRNSTITLVSVGKRHAGNYVCVVKTFGHPPVSSQPAVLQVREKLKFIVTPSATTLELGTVRRILCRAQGTPAPIIRWVKETKPLSSWPAHIVDINGTLFFHGVQDDDAGQYSCIATNSQGLIRTSINISVTMSPNFTSLPNNVTYTKPGNNIELHCKANGYPSPTIRWDKDTVMDGFTSDRFVVYSNGSLTIRNVQMEDEGFYGCTAGNAGGFKRAEFRLVVQDWDFHTEHDGESITKTIIITLGAAAAYIFLSVGLLIWCRLKRRQRKLRSQPSNAGVEAQLDTQTALLAKDDHAEKGTPAEKLNIPMSVITKGSLLGKGRFGDILEGTALGLTQSESSTHVLLRTLNTRDEDLVVEFRRQIDMLHRIRHVNLVAILGYSRESSDAQMVLMEYHQLCNLKSHLQTTSASTPWSAAQIRNAALQIARGMNALAQARFVHRDLGTRNILIRFQGRDNEMTLKIGSFGMEKQPFSCDYFVYKHQTIPLRWLPHEATFEDEYSTKSDVWMFAVTIWEIYNGALQPLASRSDEVLLSDLKKRVAIWDASFCKSNAMSSLLLKCWSHDPLLRPSFEELLHCIESLIITD